MSAPLPRCQPMIARLTERCEQYKAQVKAGSEEIERLRAALEFSREQLRLADNLLKPLARVADSGDHFNHDGVKPICSWRIGGVRHVGPSMADCRNARDFVYARPAYPNPTGGS